MIKRLNSGTANEGTGHWDINHDKERERERGIVEKEKKTKKNIKKEMN